MIEPKDFMKYYIALFPMETTEDLQKALDFSKMSTDEQRAWLALKATQKASELQKEVEEEKEKLCNCLSNYEKEITLTDKLVKALGYLFLGNQLVEGLNFSELFLQTDHE